MSLADDIINNSKRKESLADRIINSNQQSKDVQLTQKQNTLVDKIINTPSVTVEQSTKKRDNVDFTSTIKNKINKTSNINTNENTKTNTSEGYNMTGKKYGDYFYQNYSTDKNKPIVEKDGYYYIFDENNNGAGRYRAVDSMNFMTTKELDKQQYEEAKKQGYTGSNNTDVREVSNQIKLDTSKLSSNEKENYKSSLIKEEQDEEKKQEIKNKAIKKDNLQSKLGTIGKNISKIPGTVVNTASELGKGIGDFAESVGDTMLQIGSSKYNPFMHLLYDGSIESGQDIAKEIIQEDASQKFFDETLGYNKIQSNGKTLQQNLDDNSFIKSDNLGGTVARGIGNMLPSIAVGNLGAGNIGSMLTMGINSYGGGIEEAYNDGANRNQANLYGLGNAAIEGVTEWITGGIPGVNKLKNIGLDNLAGKGLNKVSNQVVKEILNAGYKMVGEGTEEALSEILKPYLKNAIYSQGEKVNWNEVMQSFIVGSITGGILEAPINVSNINGAINGALPKVNINGENLNSQQKLLPTANINNQYNEVLPTVKGDTLDSKSNTLNNNIQKSSLDNNIFSQQIDAVINGTYPKNDMLTVIQNTPKILQDIGLKDLPITLTQRHLKTVMNSNGEYKGANYHNLGADLVKQLPQAISNPLNVLKSSTDSNSIVVVTELADKQDRPIIASIKIDGKGVINNIEIDSNVMTSAYGKDNYDSFMKKNIANGNMLYDIDEGIIKRSGGKLQLRPTTSTDVVSGQKLSSNNNPSIDNISQSNNNVKSNILPKYSMQNYQNNTQELDNSSFFNNTNKLEEKNSKILDPIEISKLTKEDANTTPKLPTVNRNKANDGESKFFDNIKDKTNMLTDKQKEHILSDDEVKYYDTITNKETLDSAFKRLDKDNRQEIYNWLTKNSDNANAIDVAEGWILLKQYADSGDTDGMVAVAKKMRDMGTKAGQTVQAFNIMSRLTPEGMVKYAQSELSEAYDKMVKNKSKEWIDKHRNEFDLKPDEVQFIMDNMKEISKMEDGYDKKVKLAEIQKLMTDKLPPEKGSGIKSWMRISMLFNPKTQVRNVVGNALIAPINYFGDIFSSYADKIVAKKTNVRTTGNMNIKAILKGMKEGTIQATNDYKKGINTKDMEGNRFEISEGKSFNDKHLIGKGLNRVEGLLNYMMDAGDRVFSQASFENSLQNQMILNNTSEITQDMIDIARNESLQRTWNDNNNYTKFVLNIRKGLNNIGIGKYGLGDVLIPFAKTPANITKAIIDYSPAGLVNTLIEGNKLRKSLSNGQYNSQIQHNFVQKLGKATAGSMLYVLGYALAKAGITTGASDDDKDTSNFLKNTLGISSYSIKIGGKSFTYDWAQPLAAPFSITANIVNSKNKKQALLEAIVGNLDTAGSILLEQSFLTSLNEVLSDNKGPVSGINNQLLSLPSRAIPTFSKQVADMVDGTQRATYEYNNPIKSAINNIIVKLPGASKTLAPSVDTMGREIKKYGGKNNIFNVFLNPANVNTENISESAKEIYEIYKQTGDKTIMPKQVAYYINQKGEKIILTNAQRAEYQKISGKIIEDNIKELKNNDIYKELDSQDKADIISNIVNYSYNKAREDVLNIDMGSSYNKVNKWVSNGGTISEYYSNKDECDYAIDNPDKYTLIKNMNISFDNYSMHSKKISEIKDKYDDTTSRKNAILNYLNTTNYSEGKKIILYKMIGGYSIKEYKDDVYKYINSLDISKTKKEEMWKELYGGEY